jgi:hypothetical protein
MATINLSSTAFVITLEIENYDPEFEEITDAYAEGASCLKINELTTTRTIEKWFNGRYRKIKYTIHVSTPLIKALLKSVMIIYMMMKLL